MRKTLFLGLVALSCASQAQLAISLGVRETGSTGGVGSNGGSTGGIEWVNLDGQSLTTDGTWQLFTFNFQGDPLTAFAGTTANGSWEAGMTAGVLEHIRIRNINGETNPITMWIDDVTSTNALGLPTNFGSFEGFANNQEVMFQEPSFSGSTSGNLVAGSTAGVDNTVSFTGAASYRTNFQFLDNTNTRWVRLTTSNTPTLPNPVITISSGSTLTFRLRAEAVPEPATLAVLGLGALVLRRRKRA